MGSTVKHQSLVILGDSMRLPKSTIPCDAVVREVSRIYTHSIYAKDSHYGDSYHKDSHHKDSHHRDTHHTDSHHRTKKNLGKRRFRGIKRRITDPYTSQLLSPPHSPRSHISQSGSLSSLHRTPSPGVSTDSDSENNAKKSRYELVHYSPETPSGSSVAGSSTTTSSLESYDDRKQRYLKTAAALRQSGLLDITMKTAELLRKNQELQRNIEALQNETRDFVTSVLSNKENRPLLTSITSRAQLYELVVPGSQSIMAVSAIPTLEASPVEMDSSSSSPDQSSPAPNTSSSDVQSESSSYSEDNES